LEEKTAKCLIAAAQDPTKTEYDIPVQKIFDATYAVTGAAGFSEAIMRSNILCNLEGISKSSNPN
jgi:hypothetical protein